MMLATLLSLSTVALPPALLVPAAPTSTVAYVDQGGVRAATRIALGTHSGVRAAVRIQAAGRTFHAWVDPNVVVQLAPDADPAATWVRLGLTPVRPLMARRQLWLVRDATDGRPRATGQIRRRLLGR